jgi:ubiquinone/menaquinone biosynthesis C-methylase UbiE
MSGQSVFFEGSAPENYDRYLGPMFFEPYAADIISRLSIGDAASVLELACGTGIVTRMLRDWLPAAAKLTATDFSRPMMALAQRKFEAGEPVVWKQADASDLPFADAEFDAVIGQFGLMFVPDKLRAMREAKRVLKPGASFLFNVWTGLEDNDFARVTHETIGGFFPTDPPAFYEIPFGYHDRAAIEASLRDAGFAEVRCDDISFPSHGVSAESATIGLVEGTPLAQTIMERDPAVLPLAKEAVANALRERFGKGAIEGKMRALIFEAVTSGR